MKVCFVPHDSKLAGTSQSLIDMVTALKKQENFEPFVLLRKHGPLEEKLKELDVPYKCIPWMNDVDRPGIRGIFKKILSSFEWAVDLYLVCFLKKSKFDLVHNNCMLSLYVARAAKKAGIPYFCHVREMIWEDHGMKLINEEENLALLKTSACNIFISEFVRDKFLKISSNNNYRVFYNAVDHERYYDVHEKYFSDKNNINILIAGRVAPGKGQLEAIKAVEILSQKHKGIKLQVVGNTGKGGKYYSDIQDYVKSHDLNMIHFIDFTDLKEIRKKCDIALICSTNEAMGRVTAESMLSGTITIGAAAGATKELIESGYNGFLYECGDPKDLADVIEYVMSLDDETLAELQENAHKYAKEKYDPDAYARKMFAVYKEVLAAK